MKSLLREPLWKKVLEKYGLGGKLKQKGIQEHIHFFSCMLSTVD
jgi:hypothetical protein